MGVIRGWELVALDDEDRVGDEAAYRATLARRQADFVRCLIEPGDETLTYDLRMVSAPRVDGSARIRVGVLVRSEEPDPGAVSDLGGLLVSLFPEAQFESMSEAAVDGFLSPFEQASTVRLERRRGEEHLGTLRRGSRPPIGFAREPTVEAPVSSTIFHVYSFAPGGSDHGRACRALLEYPHPVAVSARIRATALTPEEEDFLEAGVEECADYARALALETADSRAALEEQTRAYQQLQTRLLEALSDDCCEMVVEIATPGHVSHVLTDAVGALVTAPSGGVHRLPAEPIHAYLMGGYDVTEDVGGEGTVSAVEMPECSGDDASARLHRLFDSVEAARAFRFPDALVPDPIGIARRRWTIPVGPMDLPATGTLAGRVDGRDFRINAEDRLRHVYVIGQTGTGKTTLLQTMILDDMEAGEGLCVIDPHGDLFRWVLDRVPQDRWSDVVLIDPTDTEYPVGMNVLEHGSEWERHHLVQEIVGMIRRMVLDEYSAEVIGPVFFQHVRMSLLLAMADPTSAATLVDFYSIFQTRSPERARRLPDEVDPMLRHWVKQVLPRLDYTSTGSDGMSMGSYISSKFQPFIFDPLLRNILGQRSSTFNFRSCMDEQKIVLVNLAKGSLTEDNARWFGMLILSKLLVEAMGRIDSDPQKRPPFHLYVDEFQSMATENFVAMLSEGRKFGLSVAMANQFVSQIPNPRITAGIFGNAGTIVGFRTGPDDAGTIAKQFAPDVEPRDFLSLPNWQAYVSTLSGGSKLTPFLMETARPAPPDRRGTARSVRARSRKAYSSRRARAERQVAESMGWADS